MMPRRLLRIGIFTGLCLASLAATADWFARSATLMGTRAEVELWHDDPDGAHRAIDAALAELHRLDALLSPYRPDSELSRLNAAPAGTMVPIGPELLALLIRSARVSERTDGAFDVTFAAAGRLYDFRHRVRPAPEALSAARERIDFRALRVDEREGKAGFSTAGMAVDLGGIAKGYAVERAVGRLRQLGVRHALVSAGGDTRVLGDRRGRPWMVAIRDPRNGSAWLTRTPLRDEAISTSGDYERYFEEDGRRYHHILNPRNGDSARELRSVTVLGPDATMTDALSTSVFVMGRQHGIELIDNLEGYETIVIDNNGRMHYSSGLQAPAPNQGDPTP